MSLVKPHKSYFVTGTDTDSGKTEICLALMEAFKAKNYVVAGFKPIACGGEQSDGTFENVDARRIKNHISKEFWDKADIPIDQQYATVNPCLLQLPVAPHIAAAEQGVVIDLDKLRDCYHAILMHADYTFVEGVGGWQVPLNSINDTNNKTTADLVKAMEIPVILVVGLKLGALNHALLTWQAINNAGVKCIAWVATVTDPNMTHIVENVQSLQQHIGAPCLGIVAYQNNVVTAEISQQLDIRPLLD